MGKKKKKTNNNKKKNQKVIKTKSPKSFLPYYFLIAGIIFILFGLIYGFKILNPTYTTWIFAKQSDITIHYVGWEAYRVGEWLFPIGLTNVISYPTGISVIYTDVIPILAFFFKLISFILPKTFQYLGLYGLLCFILQGIFSAKIAKKFTDSKLNIITVSILFTIIPSMMFRMFYHTALASQWLLLLALETIFLYNDFQKNKKIYYMWAIISFLVSTIHIYYLLMCGIILVGYILLDILNTKKINKSIILLVIYLLVALISIYIFGGFTNLGTDEGFGYGLGIFSYNLNGLINPQGWSIFLENLPMIEGQYEGFSYLGLGVIILIIIATILTIIWFIKDKSIIKKYKNIIISLSFISLVSVFISLSPTAYIGEHLLYDLELPTFIEKIWEIFRSTGRFIWPIIHILTLLSVIIILKRLNWKISFSVLAICAFIQVIDVSSTITDLNDFYTKEYIINEEYSPYYNESLQKVANNKKIKYLVLVSDNFYDSDLIIYSDWAINNNIKTNNFHFARTSFDSLLKENTIKLLEEKDETKVYVFTDKNECINNELHCYPLPADYYLGYINELE